MGKLAMLGGLIGVRLPEKLQTLIYRNRDTYRGETIDVQALALGHLANTVRIPGHLPTVAESREQSEKTGTMFDRKAPPLARIEDFEINGADGPIAARLYSDTVDKSQLQPAVIYAHGGGFVQGSLDSHHAVCAKLAKWSGGIVVAVDYRLAPEYPFPHGVNDFMAAFKSLAENGTSLGIDVNRMGVAGDSAGACLAAVASAELSGSPVAPKFQVLIYPVTDGHLNSQSVNDLEHAYILPKERMTWYLELYRGKFDNLDDPKFSPLFTSDFSKLPLTYVLTAGFDPLCDDGLAYADKLSAAGVTVTRHHFPGQIHAFVNLTAVIPQGTKALAEIAKWLQEHW